MRSNESRGHTFFFVVVVNVFIYYFNFYSFTIGRAKGSWVMCKRKNGSLRT